MCGLITRNMAIMNGENLKMNESVEIDIEIGRIEFGKKRNNTIKIYVFGKKIAEHTSKKYKWEWENDKILKVTEIKSGKVIRYYGDFAVVEDVVENEK